VEANAVAKSGGGTGILAINKSLGSLKNRAQRDNQLLDDKSVIAKASDQLVVCQLWEGVTEVGGGASIRERYQMNALWHNSLTA